MNKSESKYFATAVRMDKALLELLEKKDFAYITVKEICAAAGVNRSTFYLHYETVGDLLEECAAYIIDDFRQSMPQDSEAFITKIRDRGLDELYLITPEYLTPYLRYIKAHYRIFKTTVEHASALKMEQAYAGLNEYVIMPILDRFGVPEADRGYLMAFYIRGLLAIITEWIEGGCTDSIEHVTHVMRLCVEGFRGASRHSAES